MGRPFNFSAGPAAIPEPVLQEAASEMLDWHGSGMGVMEMSHRGREFISIYERAEADIRGFIDSSQLYVNKVDKSCRSRMNVPFFLRDEALNQAFLAGAVEHGLLQLKGHKSVGGMRASIYNAMPLAGVQALVDYMREFEKTKT